jgi:RNA polymerase sigma-70 factor (ECF subfamily)
VEPTDDELMARYAAGGADAFEVIFARYRASVYNFARYMLNGTEGAEDVMQDVFLAVARNATRYAPSGRFRPWLMRITRNLCLNRLREARDGLAIGGGPVAREPASSVPSGPEALGSREGEQSLRRAIADLPERQREALLLRAFEEMSYREIADALQTPINTVKTLIHRARASLARTLEEN